MSLQVKVLTLKDIEEELKGIHKEKCSYFT
jgi:hypothetical protein